jgi:hypothetical protein
MARLLLCLLWCSSLLAAADPTPAFPQRPFLELPQASKELYRNRTGDCVQDSLGMNGASRGLYNPATLVWDSEFGKPQLGGSSPSRVTAYCRERGIPIWNVTGRSMPEMEEWAEWSLRTGRGAAIGYFGNHFQFLIGRDYEKNTWHVQNNWPGTFETAYEHTPEQFRRNHKASGYWMVIIKGPPPGPDPHY